MARLPSPQFHGAIEFGEYWLRLRRVVWRYQTVNWIIVDGSSVRLFGIRLRDNLQQTHSIAILGEFRKSLVPSIILCVLAMCDGFRVWNWGRYFHVTWRLIGRFGTILHPTCRCNLQYHYRLQAKYTISRIARYCSKIFIHTAIYHCHVFARGHFNGAVAIEYLFQCQRINSAVYARVWIEDASTNVNASFMVDDPSGCEYISLCSAALVCSNCFVGTAM